MSRLYILDGEGNPEPMPDLATWGQWCMLANRTLQRSEVNGLLVSTVFLGMDHSYGSGPPLLWETMVFQEGSSMDVECQRYATRSEALAGHAALVARATKEPDSFTTKETP